jgi:hypothetical protein
LLLSRAQLRLPVHTGRSMAPRSPTSALQVARALWFSYAMIVVFAGTLVVTVIGSATVLLGL